MWPLRWFRFDDQIESGQVYVAAGPDGEAGLLPCGEAIALARARGLNLIAEWPQQQTTGPPWCWIGKVSLPLRWEQPPAEPQAAPDPDLWFEAPCGGRDLLTGSGATFPGRMAAWCPDKRVAYNVSLGEMGQMSPQARYFAAGFLAGNQPGPPPPDSDTDDVDPGDLAAWMSATARFRRTGVWAGRWRTCRDCGCVLLPDADDDYCWEHRPGLGRPRTISD